MKKILFLLFFLATISLSAQTFHSFVMHTPTYEEEILDIKTTFNIQDSTILIYNASYEGEKTKLKIDSITNGHGWRYEENVTKTYYCTLDAYKPTKVIILDIIDYKNAIKVVYILDAITIDTYTYTVNKLDIKKK